MTTHAMLNRRPLASRHIQRQKVDLRVRVTPDGEHTIHGRTNDLTKEGIGVLLPTELRIGARATIEFSLPNRLEPLRVRGLLRHRHGFRTGFEFVHLSSEQRHLIRHFCQEQPLR